MATNEGVAESATDAKDLFASFASSTVEAFQRDGVEGLPFDIHRSFD